MDASPCRGGESAGARRASRRRAYVPGPHRPELRAGLGGSRKGYRRALELNPGYANAHHWYGYYLMLTGRLKEAEAEMRRALELDPLSPIINANIGMCFYVARQYDAAIAHWRKALEMHRNYRLLHEYMTTAYVGKEMYREAVAELQKGLALSGAGPSETAILAHIYGRMGRTRGGSSAAVRSASPAEMRPPTTSPSPTSGLGDNDSAFKWLEKALQERAGAVQRAERRSDVRSAARRPSVHRPGAPHGSDTVGGSLTPVTGRVPHTITPSPPA